MKNSSIAAVLVAAFLAAEQSPAQDFQRVAPKTGTPTPEQKFRADTKTATETAAAQDKLVSEDLGSIKGVVILPSQNEFVPAGVPGVKGTAVRGPEFLKAHSEQVSRVVAPYLGKPLTESALKRLQTELIKLCRDLDHPVVDVLYPPQEIIDGVFQVVVYEGRVGKIIVDNPGHKYFSDDYIRHQVRLQPGESIEQSKLLRDLDWLNKNPSFLEVDAAFKPADWDEDQMQKAKYSTTDVDLKVKDRFPLRVYGGYDDYGPDVLGVSRVFGGATYGNLFGLEQRLNYQYTTDVHADQFWGHGASYVIPLPWRHTLTFFGAYDTFNADLSKLGFDSGFRSQGTTYQMSARYSVPIWNIGTWQHEVSGGFDFKSSDNDLEFVTHDALSRVRTEIDQFTGEYHGYGRDMLGYTSVGVFGYYSPGGLSDRNRTADFQTARAGTDEHYLYGRAELERGFSLPAQFLLLGRGTYQLSNERLLPSEQLGLGGYNSVRGYAERIVEGDTGYLASVELHSPIIRWGNITRQTGMPGPEGDTFEVLGFFDYGEVRSMHQTVNDDPKVALASVGAGVRLTISQNLLFNFDYGFQLRNAASEDPTGGLAAGVPASLVRERSRMHVSVTLSF